MVAKWLCRCSSAGGGRRPGLGPTVRGVLRPWRCAARARALAASPAVIALSASWLTSVTTLLSASSQYSSTRTAVPQYRCSVAGHSIARVRTGHTPVTTCLRSLFTMHTRIPRSASARADSAPTCTALARAVDDSAAAPCCRLQTRRKSIVRSAKAARLIRAHSHRWHPGSFFGGVGPILQVAYLDPPTAPGGPPGPGECGRKVRGDRSRRWCGMPPRRIAVRGCAAQQWRRPLAATCAAAAASLGRRRRRRRVRGRGATGGLLRARQAR
jgi:hypothetical protein